MAGFEDKNLPLFESEFISDDEEHIIRSAIKMCYMIYNSNTKSETPDPRITNLVALTVKYLNYEGLFTEKPRMVAVIDTWDKLNQDYIADGIRIRVKEALKLEAQRLRKEREENEISSGYNFLSDIDVEYDDEEAPLTQRSPLVARVLNYSTTFLKMAKR